jgi:hypothetical protein
MALISAGVTCPVNFPIMVWIGLPGMKCGNKKLTVMATQNVSA